MTYTRTRWACYIALFTQAVVNNLAPILFVVFQDAFHASFESLGRLVLINFIVQLITDLLAVRFADRIGPRRCMLLSHLLSGFGLIFMALLPTIMPDAYTGLCIATVIYAVGGGLNEVMASPILESLPSKSKSGAMSFLHSFYCWGQVAVVLLSTVYLKVFLDADWRILPLVWAVIPLINVYLFWKAPFLPLVKEGKGMTVKALFSKKRFLLFLVIMLCAGASELCMAQWSSLFAQRGLGVDKFFGDMMGPCLFAVFMGMGRVLSGIFGERIPVKMQLMISSGACVACYLIASLATSPIFALCGCAFCGLTVAVLWPATYSLGAQTFPHGGAVLFGMMAMAGDLGCSLGPWLTGLVSDLTLGQFGASNALRFGLFVGAVFPLLLLSCLVLESLFKKK